MSPAGCSEKNEYWMAIAFGQLGIREKPGPGDNPEIVEMHQHTTLRAQHDDVPWCSSFVNSVMDASGHPGTHSAAARSWLQWGAPTSPRYGCIAVISRGANPSLGHVGFYLGPDPADASRFLMLGGNQSDRVDISAFPKSNILGCRWPA
ncbi:MAG: TIGR02594 family protein [Syntrophobacter sp.]